MGTITGAWLWLSADGRPVTGVSIPLLTYQDALSQSFVAIMAANIRVFPDHFQRFLLRRNKIRGLSRIIVQISFLRLSSNDFLLLIF
ncbi:hypothetical protein ACOQFS_04065 [Paracidovorax sp. MALMAid1276]